VTELQPNWNPGTGRIVVIGLNFINTTVSLPSWFQCKFNTTLSTALTVQSGQRRFGYGETVLTPVRAHYTFMPAR
jgi:hypothetical protein